MALRGHCWPAPVQCAAPLSRFGPAARRFAE